MKCFLDHINNHRLVDVLVAGYAEREQGKLNFRPLFDYVYFMFDDKLFELSLGVSGWIDAQIVERIEPWFEHDEDEFATMSIYTMLFGVESNVIVLDSSFEECKIGGALTLRFKEAEGVARDLIIDPKNFFGFTFSVI